MPSGLKLGVVEARQLIDILSEVGDRHPDATLREFGPRGPRGRWTVTELLEAVKQDMAAMSPQERARFDRFRYIWGYDEGGKVQIVHLPVKGGFETQFAQE